jgi:hypothetical protein
VIGRTGEDGGQLEERQPCCDASFQDLHACDYVNGGQGSDKVDLDFFAITRHSPRMIPTRLGSIEPETEDKEDRERWRGRTRVVTSRQRRHSVRSAGRRSRNMAISCLASNAATYALTCKHAHISSRIQETERITKVIPRVPTAPTKQGGH